MYLLWYPAIIIIYPDSAEIANFENSYFYYYIYIFLLLINLPVSFFLSKLITRDNKKSKNDFNLYPRFLLKISFILISLVFLYFIFKIGINVDTFFSRLNRDDSDFMNQSWIVFIIIAQGIIFTGIYLIDKLSKFDKWLLWILIFLFIFFEVFLFAGRRNSLAIILFFSYRKGLVNKLFSNFKGIIFIISMLVFGILFGVIREIIINPLILIDGYDLNSIISLSLNANEFNEISRSLFGLVDRLRNYNFEFGNTYLDSLTIFIPRSIYHLKPISFVFRFDVAASPITEGYVNFGLMGFLPVLILLTVLRNAFKSVNQTFFSSLLIAYSFDIFRSNLATFFYSLIIISSIFIIFTKRNDSVVKI